MREKKISKNVLEIIVLVFRVWEIRQKVKCSKLKGKKKPTSIKKNIQIYVLWHI